MKAVIYSRVSTQEQSTDNQLGVLTAWAEHLELKLKIPCFQWLINEGFSQIQLSILTPVSPNSSL